MFEILTTMMISSMTVLMSLLLSHPILLMVVLIMQTLGTLMAPSSVSENSWLSYIIFLIFLGGLLIIFIYLASMVPNELVTNKTYISFLVILVPLMWSLYNFVMKDLFITDSNQLFFMNFNLSLSMLPLMMSYLLLTMCLSIFLSSFLKAPIKQSIN